MVVSHSQGGSHESKRDEWIRAGRMINIKNDTCPMAGSSRRGAS